MPIKQQFDSGGHVESGEVESAVAGLSQDYYLLLMVLGLLGLFYIVIAHILSDANADRVTRLDKLNVAPKKSS